MSLSTSMPAKPAMMSLAISKLCGLLHVSSPYSEWHFA